MADERLQALENWLVRDCGLEIDTLEPASSDASFRRYFRVRCAHRSYVAMDAPPAQEDSGPFLRVAGMLEQMGLNAPRVLTADLEQGFLLLTDLGDRLYLQALEAQPDAADRLYRAAIGSLVRLQARGRDFEADLPAYDVALLDREMALFRDWLCDRHLGLAWSEEDEEAWRALTAVLRDNALTQPQVFVHRDYHSRNLMLTGEDPPGILDFQDAVHGPVTYDLVSLLKDCYVSWPRDRILLWAEQFRREAAGAGINVGADMSEFRRWFDLMGVQRHLKASGIFARLWHRDGKPRYLLDVPRTLSHITSLAGEYEELEWLQDLVGERVWPALRRQAS